MNTKQCKDCANYHVITRGHNKGPVPTTRGVCLAQSVYASNAAGPSTAPPTAELAVLPFGKHKLTIVKGTDIKPHCNYVR